jgi:Zn-finger nucleic acid-binding protein
MSEQENVRTELDSLVESLRSSGQVHSSGSFTLDPARALEKMRSFQSADPYEYILWLVAAAFCGQATRLDVLKGVGRTAVSFDGPPLTHEELSGLLQEGVLQKRTRIGHLAVAVGAALNLGPKELVIESGDVQVRIDDGFQVEYLGERQEKTTFLMLFDPGPKRLFAQLVSETNEELALMSERCRRSRLVLTYNGEACGKCEALCTSPAATLCFRREGEYDIPSSREGSYPIHLDEASPGVFSADLGLMLFKGTGSNEISFLLDGVEFRNAFLPSSKLAIFGEVSSSTFMLDLSRQNIVMNNNYFETVKHLKAAIEQLARAYLDGFEGQEAWRRNHTFTVLGALEGHWRQGDPVRAARCLELQQRYNRKEGSWYNAFSSAGLATDIGERLSPPPPLRTARTAESEAPSRKLGPAAYLLGAALLLGGKIVLGGAVVACGFLTLRRSSSREETGSPRPTPHRLSGNWGNPPSDSGVMLERILPFYDSRSAVRFGIGHSAGWWTWDGTLEDGTRMLVRLEKSTLTIDLTPPYPREYDFDGIPLQANICNDGRGGQIRFDPAEGELSSLVSDTLKAYKVLQLDEELPCPCCKEPMEKILLDVLVDRCQGCVGVWFDYREVDKVFPEKRPKVQFTPDANCPRCHVSLESDYRGGMDCGSCSGVWLKGDLGSIGSIS